MSVHEFYRLKALITFEKVNTTEGSEKKKRRRILISNIAMVGCGKLSLYANKDSERWIRLQFVKRTVLE